MRRWRLILLVVLGLTLLLLVRSYTLAFFDQTLKGRPSTLLTRSHADQEVAVEVYPAH